MFTLIMLAQETRQIRVSAMDSFKNVLNNGDQFLRLERLCNICIYPSAKTCDAVSQVILSCEEYDWNESRARARAKIARPPIAVHSRHSDVANDQIRQRLSDSHHCFGSASRRHDFVSFGAQCL